MTEKNWNKQQHLTVSEAYQKAVAYCHYQERCQQEVRTKLFSHGLTADEADELIVRLSQEGLLDEERYAASYARGKHYQKKWGRNKIRQGLKSKAISEYCIKKGLAEIDPDDYWRSLLRVAEKRVLAEKENHPRLRRQKLLLYLFGRGYEQDLAAMALDEAEGKKE